MTKPFQNRRDPAAKQILATVAAIFAFFYLGATVLLIFTGSWAGIGAVTIILGSGLLMAGLWEMVLRAFPDTKEQP
jgi:hypothetical protein